MKPFRVTLCALLLVLLFVSSGVSQESKKGEVRFQGYVRLEDPTLWPSKDMKLVLVIRDSKTLAVEDTRILMANIDTTCYINPIGCPWSASFNYSYGNYIVSLEMQDEKYINSKGKIGAKKVVGYYVDPRNAKKASPVKIGPGKPTSVTFNLGQGR